MANKDEDGMGSGVTEGSGEGGSGGRDERYLYCLVCFGRFGLDGGGKGFASLDLDLLVSTMKRV